MAGASVLIYYGVMVLLSVFLYKEYDQLLLPVGEKVIGYLESTNSKLFNTANKLPAILSKSSSSKAASKALAKSSSQYSNPFLPDSLIAPFKFEFDLAIEGFKEICNEVYYPIIKKIIDFLNHYFQIIISNKYVSKLIEFLTPIYNRLTEFLTPIYNKSIELINPVLNQLNSFYIEIIKPNLIKLFDIYKSNFEKLVNFALPYFTKIGDFTLTIFEKIESFYYKHLDKYYLTLNKEFEINLKPFYIENKQLIDSTLIIISISSLLFLSFPFISSLLKKSMKDVHDIQNGVNNMYNTNNDIINKNGEKTVVEIETSRSPSPNPESTPSKKSQSKKKNNKKKLASNRG
ncbi:hypothetical protein BVG19_g4552 [[Candida] boidinii]|nr:hypothetical protein BVG19_g4552 [[Candida] boidinii]OWB53305.1 hypothetical protein B5S27_g4898 [[Candida] boidinii]